MLKCVTCLFRLAHDFDLRRHLVKDEVRTPEALGAVLCRPHLPEVVSATCDTLNLLCMEGDVTSSLPDCGVLNAILTLGLKVPADHVPVLHSATTLLTTMSKDRRCLRFMNAKVSTQTLNLNPKPKPYTLRFMSAKVFFEPQTQTPKLKP